MFKVQDEWLADLFILTGIKLQLYKSSLQQMVPLGDHTCHLAIDHDQAAR
jgi:hypothetical protein